MLSKRGKANGKATAKKAPRTARANRKSTPKRFQGRPGSGGYTKRLKPPTGHRLKSFSAPRAFGFETSNFFGFRWSVADPNDEYPEGGLRIIGSLPGSSSGANLIQDTAAVGLFGSGGGVPTIAVHPCGITTTFLGSMFSASGPLATFAQYFRRYRFRNLAMEIDPIITPNGVLGGNGGATVLGAPTCQLAYEHDPWSADQNTYSNLENSVTQNVTRFSGWETSHVVPIIKERKHSVSDELFYTDTAGDAITSAASAAELRGIIQGAVIGVANVVNTLADAPIAKVLYRFAIDLYGFTNQASTILPCRHLVTSKDNRIRVEKPRIVPEPPSCTCGFKLHQERVFERGDAKYPLTQSSDCDFHEFVELTPNSTLRIRPDMVVDQRELPRTAPSSVSGARISSKK